MTTPVSRSNARDTPPASAHPHRHELLIAHGHALPARGHPAAAALFRFLDGEALGPQDSLDLCRWLARGRPQDADLLDAMARTEPSFVPVLDLMHNGSTHAPGEEHTRDTVALLERACAGDLRFGAVGHTRMPVAIAEALWNACAQGRVHSLDCTGPIDTPAHADTQRWLRACVNHPCVDTLSGPLELLALVEHGVPQLALRAPKPPVDPENHLLRVLQQGRVERLSMCSDHPAAHVMAAFAVATAHAVLPASRAVREVVLTAYASCLQADGTDVSDAVLALVAGAHPLRDLVLDHPGWLVGIDEAAWAEVDDTSLLTLGFARDLGVDPQTREALARARAALDPLLQRNLQAERRASLQLTLAWSSQLTGDGNAIDPLAAHLAETFRGTRTLKALAVSTTRAAREAWRERTANG